MLDTKETAVSNATAVNAKTRSAAPSSSRGSFMDYLENIPSDLIALSRRFEALANVGLDLKPQSR